MEDLLLIFLVSMRLLAVGPMPLWMGESGSEIESRLQGAAGLRDDAISGAYCVVRDAGDIEQVR